MEMYGNQMKIVIESMLTQSCINEYSKPIISTYQHDLCKKILKIFRQDSLVINGEDRIKDK